VFASGLNVGCHLPTVGRSPRLACFSTVATRSDCSSTPHLPHVHTARIFTRLSLAGIYSSLSASAPHRRSRTVVEGIAENGDQMRSGKILIVDGEPDMVENCARILGRAGHECVTTTDAGRALELAATSGRGSPWPALPPRSCRGRRDRRDTRSPP
jgi:hypothetical protein